MSSCGGSPRPARFSPDRRYKLTICPRARPIRAGGIPHGASVAAVGLRSRSVVAAGAFLFLLAGCASAAQIRTAAEPCVPPGMPPVLTWVMFDSRVVAMRAPDRQTIFAALIEYRVGTTHVRGMWIGRALIFVDPDAD